MLGNFRLQQGSMECVSPSRSVLRRHTEWELVMREKGLKKSAFGSWEDTKESKQYALQRSLFHAVQWVHVIIGLRCPFSCINGERPLSTQLDPTTHRRCLSAPQQLCSVASEDLGEDTGSVSKLRDCLGYGEEQCNLLFSSSAGVFPWEKQIKKPIMQIQVSEGS